MGTLLNVMWQLRWEGSLGGMDTCIWIAESLCCPPETIIMLLSAIHQYKIQRKKKYWSRLPFPTLWNPGIKPVCLASPALAGWFFITMPTGKPHNAVLLSHKKKKEWNNAICTSMDGSRDCHTEWSRSDREWHLSCVITCMWNLKKCYKWTYLPKRNRVTHIENKLTVTEGEGGWGTKEKTGADIHTTVVEQAISKNLQYSPGNYAKLCNHIHGNKS